MTSQDKLIYFMRRKSFEITRLTGVKGKRYFNSVDANDIQNWDDEKALELWGRIKFEVFSGEKGLNGNLCPFCFYSEGCCEECSYQAQHEKCGKSTSDFEYVTKELDLLEETLTTAFYKGLLEQIDEED